MELEAFAEMALRASREFPRKDGRYGSIDFIQAMKAIEDAGFAWRPNWDLVSDLRNAFACTNPAGVMLLISEAHRRYFGAPRVQDRSLRGDEGPRKLRVVAAA